MITLLSGALYAHHLPISSPGDLWVVKTVSSLENPGSSVAQIFCM